MNTHNPKKIDVPPKRIASCMTGAASESPCIPRARMVGSLLNVFA